MFIALTMHNLLITSLLLLPTVLSACAVRADPASDRAAELDRWLADTDKSFRNRNDEIAKGVNNSLEPELVAAEKEPRTVTVRKDGTGDYETIADALGSIPEGNARRTVVRIGPGVYREKVTVNRTKPYVTFLGEADDMPTIMYDGRAAEYGTLESATVAVDSDYFIASNIIFENSAPRPVLGVSGAQAVAMRISGDEAAFYNCKFLGYQDTLCDDRGKHFFKDCHIRGTVDFIFGNGRSIYMDCKIESVADGETWITAQARANTTDVTGFSFLHCNITGTGNVYLSRAWKQSSRVVFAYTYMSDIVNPEGWNDHNDPSKQESVFYGEYACMGPGAATEGRVGYAKILTKEAAEPFLSMTFVLAKTWLLPPPKL